jgi:hypothetical protein
VSPDNSPFTAAAEAAEETFVATGSRAAARDTYRRVLGVQLRARAVERRVRRAEIVAAHRRARRDRQAAYRVRLLRLGTRWSR